MALITVQSIALTGLEMTYEAASVSDTFANNGRTFIHAKNADGSDHTLTINSLVDCNQGEDHNPAVVVTAGEERMVGPFPMSRFNSATGIVTATWEDATSVTIAVLSLD